jgi:uncharacterized pyridoxamine 5'-phosphate oxidase family protein
MSSTKKPDPPIEKLSVPNPKAFVYEFLRRHTLAVLSTVDGTNPEAAVIEFSELRTLELIFETNIDFRKYHNLLKNPHVALVVGWDDHLTLQYEGLASELREPERSQCKAVHLKKIPDAEIFDEFVGTTYFKIAPRWIRYTDHTDFPRKRFEIRFD